MPHVIGGFGMEIQQAILLSASTIATFAVHLAVAGVLALPSVAPSRVLPKGDGLSHVMRVSFSQPGGLTGNADNDNLARSTPVPPAAASQPAVTKVDPAAARETHTTPPTLSKRLPVNASAPAAPATQPQAAPPVAVPVVAAAPARTPAPEQTEPAPQTTGKAGLNDDREGGARRSGVATGDAIPAEFSRALLTRLARNKHYPFKARIGKIEGVGKVYFEVDARGNLMAFRLLESTRSAELDNAIQQLFNKSFPLPPMIARLGPQQGAAFTLPIAYYLNQ